MYYGERALAALRTMADVRLNPEARELSTPELQVLARDCDAIVAYRQTPAPAELFAALPGLAVFLRCAMDIRTVDVDAASRQGVLVTRASAGFQAAVAEWIIAVMIDLGRGITLHDAAYKRGATPEPFIGHELRGSTLGIVGLGAIGSVLLDRALAFGMEVQVHTLQAVEPRAGVSVTGFDALVSTSDFVVCLAPANAQTERLFDARAFGLMRAGAFFVNASRGELVDDVALLAALDSGRLAACAMDVGRAPDQMPTAQLAAHPRVLATPHIGGLTRPATEHQALETVDQLRALRAGRLPDGAVNAADAARWRAWPKS